MQSIIARLRNKPITSGLAILGVLLVLWFVFGRGDKDATPYRTQAVDKGEILRAVSATGQLQPLVTVNVGSTVSGPVLSVDVDFNSTVKANQVLAKIDPQSFQTKVDQLRAGVAQANANLAAAQADYGRYKVLSDQGFASDQLMTQQRTAVQVARAQVATAASQLSSAQIDIGRTVIRSPVDGVVVSRQVDPGQSVAASFQAPVLFQIAQDLSKLEAAISVDEADIGDVREGQPVNFTVDAFPGEEFDGKVVQLRKQGIATTGVVSYTVMVEASNASQKLLPGMTANAEIIIERKENVLRAPNAALRFKPTDEKLVAQADALRGGGSSGKRSGGAQAADTASSGQGGGQGAGGANRSAQMVARMAERLKLTPSQTETLTKAYAEARANAGPPPGQEAARGARQVYQRKIRDAAMASISGSLTAEQKTTLAAMSKERESTRNVSSVLWVLRDKKPVPVKVTLGVASDSYTEILDGDIKEGDELITGGGPKPKTTTTPGGQGGPGGAGGMRIRGA